jgi:predicted DNA-binding transcriptional regulator AlpA
VSTKRMVDVTTLMGVKDIADRLGTTPAMVHSYFDRRATSKFPEPVGETSGGRLWTRPDVEEWIVKHNAARPRGGRRRLLPELASAEG